MSDEKPGHALLVLDHPHALPFAIGIGAVLRGIHLTGVTGSPLFSELLWDAKLYDAWASDIAAGHASTGAFWLDPLYAYLLAALYRVFGHHLLVPRLFGAACGLCAAWLVSRIARNVWNSRAAEIGAALISGFYLPAVHYESIVGKTALSGLLVTASVALLFAASEVFIPLCGAALGFLALARGNLVFLLPLFAIILLFGWDRAEPETTTSRFPASPRLLMERLVVVCRDRRRQQRVLMLVATALPIIGIATIHNGFATGEFIPTTTNFGINFYLGNHSGNVDGSYTPPPFLPASNDNELASFRAEAERRTGNVMSDKELSGYWAEQAWGELRANPGRTVVRTLHKLELLVHDDEIADSDTIEVARAFSPALRLPALTWGHLLPLSVLGAVIGWKRRRVRCLTAIGVACLATLLPFFILGRLRAPVAPLLAVLAAGVPEWLWAKWQEHRMRGLGPRALVFLSCSVLACFYRPAWMASRYATMLAVNWYNLGSTLLSQGRTSDARFAFENAVSSDDKSVPAALRALAQMHEQRGDLAEAASTLERLVEIRPDSPSAQASLRRIRELRASGASPLRPAKAMKTPAPTRTADQPDPALPRAAWRLSPETKAKLVAELSKSPPETPAWLSYDDRDSTAKAMASDLSEALEEAHWAVRALQPERIPLKPGLYMFASGEPTQGYTALLGALKQAGYEVRNGTQYTDFVLERRKENPSFRSLYFADRQEYLFAIGRAP